MPIFLRSRFNIKIQFRVLSILKATFDSFQLGQCFGNKMCRFGCHCVEDVEHVLFNCVAIQAERQALKDLCYETKIDFNLINIMTQPSLLQLCPAKM